MNNLIVMPLVLPIMMGIILVFFRKHIQIQRVLSLLTMVALIVISIVLLQKIQTTGIMRVDLGGWLPPYGISFVADSFAVLLVLVGNIVAMICLFYAFSSIGDQHEKMYFYPFYLLLVSGVNGSFLTGDIFNLFVCFEVMLLASYALITLGGDQVQLRESLKYVLINVLASWFFLVALAYLYGALGTLNMAHLSVRVAQVGQDSLLTTIALLFLLVFALKAGLLLFYWLPGSYSVPPTAVAALFGALLTKVGIYALIRIFTLVFYHQPEVTHVLIESMAVVTVLAGCLGAIAYKDLRQIVAYNVVIGVGFVLMGLGAATEASLQGSIYYLMHDMIAKAMLFLVVGTMISLTGKGRFDRISGLIRHYPLFGWMFFVVMLALAGFPPLSGFVGKILIGQGLIETKSYILLAIAFFSSVVVLYSLLRVFLQAVFGETSVRIGDEKPLPKGQLVPIILLASCTISLGIGTEGISNFIEDAAMTLSNPEIYIQAVLEK